MLIITLVSPVLAAQEPVRRRSQVPRRGSLSDQPVEIERKRNECKDTLTIMHHIPRKSSPVLRSLHQASAPTSAESANCQVVGAGRNKLASSGGRKIESEPSNGRPRSVTPYEAKAIERQDGHEWGQRRVSLRPLRGTPLTVSMIHGGKALGLTPVSGQLNGPRSSKNARS